MSRSSELARVREVLARLSELSCISDEIVSICKKHNIKSSVSFEQIKINGLSVSDQSYTDGPAHISIAIRHVVSEGSGAFPRPSSEDYSYTQNICRMLFMNGPIIGTLHINPVVADESVKYQGTITVSTRSLGISKENCAYWRLEIQVVGNGDFQEEREINSTLRDYMSRIGKFKSPSGSDSVISEFHFMLHQILTKNVRALNIAELSSGGKIKVPDCLAILGMGKLARKKFLDNLKSFLDQNTLADFISMYFSPLGSDRVNWVDNISSTEKIKQDIWSFKPGDPFDFLRLLFLILSIVMREMKFAEKDIKDICKEKFESVTKSILYDSSPLDPNYDSFSSFPLIIPLGYSDVISEDTLRNWKERLSSVDAHVLLTQDGIKKDLSPAVPLNSIYTFIEHSHDLFLDGIEEYFEAEKNFIFNRPYSKVKKEILDSALSITLVDEPESSQRRPSLTLSLEDYRKSLFALCTTLKRYLISNFTS